MNFFQRLKTLNRLSKLEIDDVSPKKSTVDKLAAIFPKKNKLAQIINREEPINRDFPETT